MCKRILAALCLALFLFGCDPIPPLYPPAEVVEWSEPSSEALIREFLGRPAGDITRGELAGITELFIYGSHITSDYDKLGYYSDEGYEFDGRFFPPDGTLAGLGDFTCFPDLETLWIVHQPALTLDAGTLAALCDSIPTLGDLEISFADLYGDVGAMASTRLWHFFTWGTNVLGDVGAFRDSPNMVSLGLCAADVSGDIAALSEMTALEDLYLWGTQVTGDIKTLDKLDSLCNIDLEDTVITGDVQVFETMPRLESVILGGTRVEGGIEAFASCENLYYLDLNNTSVGGRVDALMELPELYYVDICGCPVAGDFEAFKRNRPDVDLRYDFGAYM